MRSPDRPAASEPPVAESAADALTALREIRVSIAASLIAVKGHLDTPYPDDPRWTPWTRFIERELHKLDDAKDALARLEELQQAAEDACARNPAHLTRLAVAVARTKGKP